MLFTARGTSFLGFSDSAADSPTSSVLEKENAATMKIPTIPPIPCINGAFPSDPPSSVQLLNPWLPVPLMIPRIISMLTMRNTIVTITLIPANQYSASPNPFTVKRFIASRIARNSIAQRDELEFGNQYLIMIAPAISSAATVMALPNQYDQPLVNPHALSIKRSAYDVNAPGIGSLVAISPSAVIIKYTTIPMTAYATIAPPGPASLMVPPIARNSPVPMDPPMAIIVK